MVAEHSFWGTLSVVATAIIGVAVLAVVVSKNSNTTSVITSTSSAFSGALSTALSPVTGSVSGLGASATFPIS